MPHSSDVSVVDRIRSENKDMGSRSRPFWRDFATALVIALTLRCIVSVFAAYVLNSGLVPAQPLDPHLYHAVTLIEPRGWYLLFAPFQRWDGIWYQLIAEQGYSAANNTTAFFPLFPALVRPLTAIATNATVAAQVVSFASTVVAFTVFYRVTARLAGEGTAIYSLLAWALFPTAFFLFAPYPESVFVLCSLLSLEAARKRRWLLAGSLAGFAALARSPGILLVVPLGVECVLAHGIYRIPWKPATIRSWLNCNLKSFLANSLGIGLVPLAVCGYMLYLYLAFGDPLLWRHALDSWQWTLVAPWETVCATVEAILFGSRAVIANNLIDLITTLIVLIPIAIAPIVQFSNRTEKGIRSGLANVPSTDTPNHVDPAANVEMGPVATLPLIYILYGVVFSIGPMMMMLGMDQEGIPLYAAGRRAIVIFPAFILIGAWLKDRHFRLVYFAVSFAAQLVLVSAFALWFWID